MPKKNEILPQSNNRNSLRKTNNSPKSPFSPNILNGNKLHSKNKDLSGCIIREVYMKDKNGNVKIARETQIINSWKKMGYFNMN